MDRASAINLVCFSGCGELGMAFTQFHECRVPLVIINFKQLTFDSKVNQITKKRQIRTWKAAPGGCTYRPMATPTVNVCGTHGGWVLHILHMIICYCITTLTCMLTRMAPHSRSAASTCRVYHRRAHRCRRHTDAHESLVAPDTAACCRCDSVRFRPCSHLCCSSGVFVA